MATQIAVPQTGQLPQVKGPEINDRDRVNDLLSFEKYLTYGYGTGLNEMQNPALHATVRQLLIEAHDIQYQLFNQMFQKGWYKMKAADQAEIAQTRQQFENYRSQIPQFS